MLELGMEVQADKPPTTQAAVVNRNSLNDLINAEMVFMGWLGWV